MRLRPTRSQLEEQSEFTYTIQDGNDSGSISISDDPDGDNTQYSHVFSMLVPALSLIFEYHRQQKKEQSSFAPYIANLFIPTFVNSTTAVDTVMYQADAEKRIEDDLERILYTWDVNTRLVITTFNGNVLDTSQFFFARTVLSSQSS